MGWRILIVDDSVIVRKLVSDLFDSLPGVEAVFRANHGRHALDKLDFANPDLIVLDLDMPEMDGFETIPEIRRRRPHVPIIVFSAQSESGAMATLRALELGATDFVPKPSGLQCDTDWEETKARLLEISGTMLREGWRQISSTLPPIHSPNELRNSDGAFDVLLLAASTGGPNALKYLLSELPEGFPLPVLICQHMPATFTGILADSLNECSLLEVREAREGDRPEAGTAWVAPGDYHMTLNRGADGLRIELNQNDKECGTRPAANPLLRSAARACRGRVLAVILTGMGRDGLEGAKEIRQAGGMVIAQDQESSAVWGMPGEVVRAGLADSVLALKEMPIALARLAKIPDTGAKAA